MAAWTGTRAHDKTTVNDKIQTGVILINQSTKSVDSQVIIKSLIKAVEKASMQHQ